MEGVGYSLENTVTNEQDLRATGRRRGGGEEPNYFLFLFYFLIPTGLMKDIFDFHICKCTFYADSQLFF